jgi:U3 small nucleolar RNA-associated protein 12
MSLPVQIWCLDSLPDRSGFVSCSADKHIKVWKWDASKDGGVHVSLTEAVSINAGQDVLCVKVSPDSKLIAASLVSNVIKV